PPVVLERIGRLLGVEPLRSRTATATGARPQTHARVGDDVTQPLGRPAVGGDDDAALALACHRLEDDLTDEAGAPAAVLEHEQAPPEDAAEPQSEERDRRASKRPGNTTNHSSMVSVPPRRA